MREIEVIRTLPSMDKNQEHYESSLQLIELKRRPPRSIKPYNSIPIPFLNYFEGENTNNLPEKSIRQWLRPEQ